MSTKLNILIREVGVVEVECEENNIDLYNFTNYDGGRKYITLRYVKGNLSNFNPGDYFVLNKKHIIAIKIIH